MRTAVSRGLPLAMVFALAGCTHAGNYRWSEGSHPTFANALVPPRNPRFGSWSDPAVTVYSFATPTPSAGDAGLRDLADCGQAAFIEAMTRAGAKADDVRDLLAKPIKAKAAQAEAPAVTEGTYKRTIVANVTKG